MIAICSLWDDRSLECYWKTSLSSRGLGRRRKIFHQGREPSPFLPHISWRRFHHLWEEWITFSPFFSVSHKPLSCPNHSINVGKDTFSLSSWKTSIRSLHLQLKWRMAIFFPPSFDDRGEVEVTVRLASILRYMSAVWFWVCDDLQPKIRKMSMHAFAWGLILYERCSADSFRDLGYFAW